MNFKIDRLSIIFSLILLSELYLPIYKLNLGFQLIFATYLIIRNNGSFNIRFLNVAKYLLGVFLMGFVGYIFNFYDVGNLIKDIGYFIKPILGIIIGYQVFRKQVFADFCKTVILLGFITAAVHLFSIVFFSNFSRDSINNLRSDFGLDNFLELFALYTIIFYQKLTGKKLFSNIYFSYVLAVFIFGSVIIYFSRTMLGGLILLALSFSGISKITKSSLKVIWIGVICIGLFYVVLLSVKLDRGSRGIEGLLYKIKISPQEIFVTKVSRDNHVKLWDHWRGYEARRAFELMNENLYSYIVGNGFGSQVNLKFEAPLGDQGEGMKYISRLHNGYVFVLYKTGIIGLLCYLSFIFKLYYTIYQKRKTNVFLTRFISAAGLFYFFTSLIVTGIYMPTDTIILLVGGALACEKFPQLPNSSKNKQLVINKG